MGKVIVTIIIIALIAVILFLVFGKGLGFGKGNGTGDGKATGSVAETVSQEAEPAVTEVKYVEVAVKKDKYIYGGSEYDLIGLMAELDKREEGANVRIKDDGGLVEARDALIEELNKKNIPYTDDTAV